MKCKCEGVCMYACGQKEECTSVIMRAYRMNLPNTSMEDMKKLEEQARQKHAAKG